jgi:glycosyltransferase involved in cell wall biosynthesis
MPSARVALVIPVIDEGATIAGVVRAVPRDVIDEIIVVDGGSRDDTVAAARAAGARVIVEPRAGYGAACLVGVAAAADCAVIAFIDGDGSDDPADLGRIVGPILAGEQDFVIGSRAVAAHATGSMGAHQLLAGRLAGLAMRALYSVRYTDMGPLRAISRDALDRLAMRELTYGWNLEMQMRAARAHLRILELPVAHRHRAGGASKVAGSLCGTLRASWNLATTFVRVARAR